MIHPKANPLLTLIFINLLLIGLTSPLVTLAQSAAEDQLICDSFEASPANVRIGYYMGQGAAYVENGRVNSAIDSYSCIIEQIDASYLNAWLNRATAYTRQRLYEEALEDYSASLELAPNRADVYNNRAIVYYAQREYELAIADLNRALEINGEYIDALSNRAVILALTDDFETAIADLEQAIAISGIENALEDLEDPNRAPDRPRPEYDPRAAQPYALLGVIYSARALDNYDDYLRLRPASADRRIESAAGALESRFTFDLRLDDGTWLLSAQFETD